jgi:hypothetical protein
MWGAEDYHVSSWDWFKVQLRLLALEDRGDGHSVSYSFQDEPIRKVLCVIISQFAQQFVDGGVSKEEQEKYYMDWLASQVDQIRDVLEQMGPRFAAVDLESLVDLEVRYHYGMGASLIWKIKDGMVFWGDA